MEFNFYLHDGHTDGYGTPIGVARAIVNSMSDSELRAAFSDYLYAVHDVTGADPLPPRDVIARDLALEIGGMLIDEWAYFGGVFVTRIN